jgi:hypothetical protein
MAQSWLPPVLRRVSRGWEIGQGGGMWWAFWKSPDGRSRRFLVAPSASQLGAALVKVAGEANGGEAGSTPPGPGEGKSDGGMD